VRAGRRGPRVGTSSSGPLVSVIIPIHDGQAFLAEALTSVFAQTWRPLEVIAVDDGSSDESSRIAGAFAGVRLLCQDNRGVAAARNAGVAVASGELVAFLDQDDRWTSDKLAIQVRHLQANPGVGFCLAHQRLFLQPGTEKPSWLKPELLAGAPIGYLPGTLLVRREVLAAVGPFDEQRPIASDSDWFFRAKDDGVEMAILPDILLDRRIHRQNQSAQTMDGTRQLLQVVRASILRQRRQYAAETS
jgi:glycosyltransferase involved in cell wall biosynthesis